MLLFTVKGSALQAKSASANAFVIKRLSVEQHQILVKKSGCGYKALPAPIVNIC